jgi:hypothetical protein
MKIVCIYVFYCLPLDVNADDAAKAVARQAAAIAYLRLIKGAMVSQSFFFV